MNDIDVLIVGAGPAGLAAALACHDHGLRFVVLERGPTLLSRHRGNPTDIASGMGGAGLFSDGKFSFFPSATDLWLLEPEVCLHQAYNRIGEIVKTHGVEFPSFPINRSLIDQNNMHSLFFTKKYESKYMSQQLRYTLIEWFSNKLQNNIYTEHLVKEVDISHKHSIQVVICQTKWSGNIKSNFSARALIFANGRLGPLFLQKILPADLLIYRRFEIGVRIQQPEDQFFLRETEALDPKNIWRNRNGTYEWRTFCCCRNGEIVSVSGDDILSVSGRSDIAPSGYSSVGFHVRLFDTSVADIIWKQVYGKIRNLKTPIIESMEIFLFSKKTESHLHDLFGSDLTNIFKEGFHNLSKEFDISVSNSMLYAPTIEGVLYYPVVDQELRLSDFPLWIAGDASGKFRGLTAALISGYFSGIRVAKFLGTYI